MDCVRAPLMEEDCVLQDTEAHLCRVLLEMSELEKGLDVLERGLIAYLGRTK